MIHMQAGGLPEGTIERLAQAPRESQTDEGRIHERSVDELVKADQYLATKKAQLRYPPHGLFISRLRMGAAVVGGPARGRIDDAQYHR